ncbi:MAG: amidohydrolase family protein, partial [Gaiellales bacterium]
MSGLDLVLRGGRVIDGSGSPWIRADVGVTGDRIVAVDVGLGSARRTVDLDGLVVSPGFVDMHTHSDIQILAAPSHAAKVHQGVTLELLGQDGLSFAPVDDDVLATLRSQLEAWNGDPPGFDWGWYTVAGYLDRLDGGVAVNAAYLAPHGTIRMLAMGQENRAPTDEELAEMKRLVATALDEGAVGLSA